MNLEFGAVVIFDCELRLEGLLVDLLSVYV